MPTHHPFPEGDTSFSCFVVLAVNGKGGRDKLENTFQNASSVIESLLPLEKIWLFKNKKNKQLGLRAM